MLKTKKSIKICYMKSIENNNEIKEKMQMVEYKDSVFKRIINKILNFLHLR